ncbi:MAG: DNA cytosine methyltransferase [Acidaminococcales bacterium]|jgi:DNA (cytosine-5)-methyltransferase 1|nr:DNA cytosine methyltransferase [Acidaminococcales bacterium]
MKKVVDLFAGCGGLSIGFQNAGFEIVGAYESWETAAACYENNFNHPVFRADLSNVKCAIESIQALNPDVIIGGPPCQDFSHAGKRIEDKRAALTEAFAEIISAIVPRWFVMENVDRIPKSATYSTARTIFKNAGYGLTEVIIDASFCGVPQRRKRFFCIGAQETEDGFLLNYITLNLSKKEMTLRDYFGMSLDFEYYYRHPRNYNRRAVYTIDEPSPTVRGMNRPVPPGYPGHSNDAKEIDSSIRALTTLERALIQTFPPNYKWSGNKTDTEQMIGNAVPVKLAEFVAKALSYHIANDENKRHNSIDYELFLDWLHNTQTMSERAQRDTLSRLKRANAICAIPSVPEAYYFFALEQSDNYKTLTPTVRSQLKRAVALYSDYRRADIPANG